MFGRGAGGGLINRVSKQAGWTRARELTLQYGANDNRRAVLDLNRGLSGRFAARVTGMYENSDSYRDYLNLERYAVTPTVTVMAGPSTQVHFGYEYFKDYRTADRGVPSFQGVPLPTDPGAFFGDPAISWSDASVNSGTATVEHATVSGLNVRNTTRYAVYHKMYQNVYPGPVDSSGTMVSILGYNNRMWRDNLFNQTDLNITRHTGRVTHTLLVGGESDGNRPTRSGIPDTSTTPPSVSVPVASPIDRHAHRSGRRRIWVRTTALSERPRAGPIVLAPRVTAHGCAARTSTLAITTTAATPTWTAPTSRSRPGAVSWSSRRSRSPSTRAMAPRSCPPRGTSLLR